MTKSAAILTSVVLLAVVAGCGRSHSASCPGGVCPVGQEPVRYVDPNGQAWPAGTVAPGTVQQCPGGVCPAPGTTGVTPQVNGRPVSPATQPETFRYDIQNRGNTTTPAPR